VSELSVEREQRVTPLELFFDLVLVFGDRDLLMAILRTASTSLAGAVLILVAGFVHGPPKPWLWLAALVVRSAIVALSLVAGVWIALHAYELIWWRADRAELRGQRVTAPVSSP
jgi:low temperature requirement protein LtrA